MYRSITNLITVLSLLTSSFAPLASADEMMDNAEKYVKETWKNVDSHAKYMAINDLRQATSAILRQSQLSGLSSGDQERALRLLTEFNSKANSIGSSSKTISAADAKALFLNQLDLLSELTKQKFTLSWEMMDWDTFRSNAKFEVARILNKYQDQCVQGHIEPGMTFQNTSPEIPAMGYSVNVTYSTGSGMSANGNVTSGKGETEATKTRRGIITTATIVAWHLHWIAGAAVTVIGAAIEFFMSKGEQNALIENAADAAAFLADNRAASQDIVKAYRKQCAALGISLSVVSEITSKDGVEGAKVLAEAKSDAFRMEYEAWTQEMLALRGANCRSNLLKKSETMGCPNESVALQNTPNYVDDPMCQVYGSGCLKIASYSDSFCRTLNSGTIRDMTQGCEINASEYKNSEQHKTDLSIVDSAQKENSDQDKFIEKQKQAGRIAAMVMILNLENSETFKNQYRQLEAAADEARKNALLRVREMVSHISSDQILNLMNDEILLNREFEKLRGRYVQLTARTIRSLVGETDRQQIARDVNALLKDSDAFFKRTAWFYHQSAFEKGLQHLVGMLR